VDPREVKQKAKQVNDISMNYHLSHAVFACNKIIEADFKEYIREKTEDYKARLQAAEKAGDTKEIIEISKKIEQLKAPCRIYIEYIKRGKARVIFLIDCNQFIITLPEELLTQSKDANGFYDVAGVKKLRWTTAHEIGHTVLHTKDLIKNTSTQGSIDLSRGKEGEEEADIFAKELLALRHKRNEDLFKTRKWQAF